ncbi:hypothetical protein INR49_009248 [Caranx melampygus]|nr:hypothetical protein INR49_009248 [Caranx melampygus]
MSFRRVKEYLVGSSLVSKLQAKHDLLRVAVEKGIRAADSNSCGKCIRYINLNGEDPLAERRYDLDSVAGVLKLYFRGLENPLFPIDSTNLLLEHAHQCFGEEHHLQHESIFPSQSEVEGPVYEKCMTLEQATELEMGSSADTSSSAAAQRKTERPRANSSGSIDQRRQEESIASGGKLMLQIPVGPQGKAWRVPSPSFARRDLQEHSSSEDIAIQVDKEVCRQMDSVFKELLSRQTLQDPSSTTSSSLSGQTPQKKGRQGSRGGGVAAARYAGAGPRRPSHGERQTQTHTHTLPRTLLHGDQEAEGAGWRRHATPEPDHAGHHTGRDRLRHTHTRCPVHYYTVTRKQRGRGWRRHATPEPDHAGHHTGRDRLRHTHTRCPVHYYTVTRKQRGRGGGGTLRRSRTTPAITRGETDSDTHTHAAPYTTTR